MVVDEGYSLPCGFESAVFKLDTMSKRDKFGPCCVFVCGDGRPTIKKYNKDGSTTTLTRIDGGLWMFFNHVKSTGGPGTIVSTAGNVTFQNDLIIDENVTFVITNSTGSL